MSESKHAPTPWRVSGVMIVGKLGNIAGTCRLDQYMAGTREANAEFIVRACNAHDDLLTACKAVVYATRLEENAARSTSATSGKPAYNDTLTPVFST